MRPASLVAVLLTVATVGGCDHADTAAPAPAPAPGKSTRLPPVVDRDGTAVQTTPPAADAFHLAVEMPAARAGVPAVLRVAVTPGAGYKLNVAYPYGELAVTPAAGLTATRATIPASAATENDEHQLAFAVELTAPVAGDYQLAGTVKFAVCTADETACLPQVRPLSVAVAVR